LRQGAGFIRGVHSCNRVKLNDLVLPTVAFTKTLSCKRVLANNQLLVTQ